MRLETVRTKEVQDPHECDQCKKSHPISQYKSVSRNDSPSMVGGPVYYYEDDYLVCPSCGSEECIGYHWDWELD